MQKMSNFSTFISMKTQSKSKVFIIIWKKSLKFDKIEKMCYNIYVFILKHKHMRKALKHIHAQTPQKDRLALVILFGVFAFTVLMDLAWFADQALQQIAAA